jgi:membrane protease YdiL (CAAX protease family)
MGLLPGSVTWDNDIMFTALFIPVTVIFYTLYWLIASSKGLKKWFYTVFDQHTANVLHVVFRRVAGFIFLGLLPLAICILVLENYTLADAGIKFNPETTRFTLISIILLSLVIIPIVSFTARRAKIYSVYPEIRASRWTVPLLLTETVTWALYLFGYEALFRGVLLFGLAITLGPAAAIIINVTLYSAAHIPKGRTETLAAIPYGIILCILTLHSGTIWIAFFTHLLNAMVTSLFAIKFNPEMSYARINKKNITV